MLLALVNEIETGCCTHEQEVLVLDRSYLYCRVVLPQRGGSMFKKKKEKKKKIFLSFWTSKKKKGEKKKINSLQLENKRKTYNPFSLNSII